MVVMVGGGWWLWVFSGGCDECLDETCLGWGDGLSVCVRSRVVGSLWRWDEGCSMECDTGGSLGGLHCSVWWLTALHGLAWRVSSGK